MIAASEPWECVPHGRVALARHPGTAACGGGAQRGDTSLLYKLTNFAIRDESLQEASEEGQAEWWCVRQATYRIVDDLIVNEDAKQAAKSTKEESTPDFLRPKSRLKNEFNVSIKSEILSSNVKKMDTDGAVGPSSGGSCNNSSNMSKKFNLDTSPDSTWNFVKKVKPIDNQTDCCYEEELYVKGRTAVWSKGLISTPETSLSEPEFRETIASYTCETPIKHAIFCNFHVDVNNSMLIDALNSQIGDLKKNIKIEDNSEQFPSELMPSVFIIDNKCMRVFSADGREYLTNIPFQVKKVWAMKYGALLEKDATPLVHNSLLPTSFFKFNESNNSFSKSRGNLNSSSKFRLEASALDPDVQLPTCFSLSHPLDEVTPVLMKSASQGLKYYNDGELQIIFVSSTPSIILVYDSKLCVHSLWRIRKASRDECLSMCPNFNTSTTNLSQSYNFGGSLSNVSTFGQKVSSAPKTTAGSWVAGMASPYSSKPTTPVMSRSRVNSPMANAFYQQGLSPHSSIGQASSTSMLANTMQQTPPTLPLYPEICLDHIWTETQSHRRDSSSSSKSTKSFLHTDLIGHDYLCYMLESSGSRNLQIMRLQKSRVRDNPNKVHLIVGAISTIQAKDAVVLDSLKMFAIIDEMGNIMLYSGMYVVGKVHVGGVLPRLIDSPYSKRTAFNSPFPRRSSLLPSRCNDAPVFDDSALHLLSPVPHSSSSHGERKETAGLQGLCDPVGNRLTLEFDKGSMFRISLPNVSSSSLVNQCLQALRSILRKDVAMKVMVKWYGVRNAPGTQDLAPEQEWSMFATFLFGLIGYDIEKLSCYDQDQSHNEPAEVASKKQRTSSDGSSDDWEYLLNGKLHKTVGNSLANMLNLQVVACKEKKCYSSYIDNKNMEITDSETLIAQFNPSLLLFPYVVQVFYSLHLLYEEIKLNTLHYENLKPMAEFLYQLARDLRLDSYTTHYWKDYPLNHRLHYDNSDSQISNAHIKKLSYPSYFNFEAPNIFQHLNALLKNEDGLGNYPYLTNVNTMSRDLVEIVGYVCRGRAGGVSAVVSVRGEGVAASSTPRARDTAPVTDLRARHRNTVIMMCDKGIKTGDLDKLPPALALLLLGELARCKGDPPAGWPQDAYRLLMREDLAQQSDVAEKIASNTEYMETLAFSVLEKETAYSQCKAPEPDKGKTKGEDNDIKTGMEHLDTKLLRLLYPRDHRMVEVCNLLQSSIPVVINLTQRPEVSDHDFIEEQEKHLYAISNRTMALPIARGMVTLRTLPCLPSEPLTPPKLCVCGRGPPPRCNTIELAGGAADAPPHCTLWPTFHNGVAAGLSLVSMTGSNIHSSWVVYNKPKGTTDISTEHAGFLMALGLNGHLKDMAFMNIYEYLKNCQEMTSIGLLLGLAATYRGTMDITATKIMSIHLEPLLPPTSIELDIHQNILVAALMGVGLIYQGTMHTHYAEVLLNEIGRPPGPEMENCVEREGYALAAGLALGLVCVGAHASAPAHLAPHLRHYMLGGTKQPLAGAQKEKFKQGSFAVREGSAVNLDVTSPGATLALGLLYLRSGNAAVAEWLAPPRTHYLLDHVRPDLLMLRLIARGLILWDSIEPYEEWVESQVPDTIKPYCFIKPTEDYIDYEAMNQAYCNIVAGACFCIGLRYAGSGDEDARDCLMEYVNLFIGLGAKSIGELAGKSTIESCLNVVLLSAGMVMCGRGDIAVLRVCRRLRARVAAVASRAGGGPAQPALTHGGQVAVHLTIGLLFAGGGRCTLSTSPAAVAALLAAFFPKFPTHSNDNRYHLQALRHLYVLAIVPRLVIPRDLASGRLCYAHVRAETLDGRVVCARAPCLLPELDTLREVRITDPRYWPIVFQRDRNWDQLKTFLEYSWCIDIKQRAGCLSYLEDPQGFLTLLAQTLTLDGNNIWSATAGNIDAFTSDENVRNLTKHYLRTAELPECDRGSADERVCSDCHFLTRDGKGQTEVLGGEGCLCRKRSRGEREFVQTLSMVAYECVVKDMLCVLPVWTTFLKILIKMKTEPSAYHMWQIKLLITQIDNHNQKYKSLKKDDSDSDNTISEPLLSNEFALSIKQRVTNIMDSWELGLLPHLKTYLGFVDHEISQPPDDFSLRCLSAFIVYYDLPKNVLHNTDSTDFSLMQCLMELDSVNLDITAVSKIASILS